MKQVTQNYKSGELRVLEVPAPTCRPGGVLVRSLYSLISTGTEMMKVSEARMSLVGKARARPDQVRKLVDSVSRQGVRSTYAKAMSRLDSFTPLGYSLSGIVTEVGAGVDEFKVGQLVACAGNEHALHAEVNWVPVNLCVPVPDGVEPRLAAFATVGAIAMHGVRRAEPQIGDVACVVGLGLVGQLVVQLLVAAGVRVVGLDVVEARCRLAERSGAMACEVPDTEGIDRLERAIGRVTSGRGVDHVLLVAGGLSNGPVEVAARLARDRARVVDIGKLKLDLPWNAYYDKELDVRFSRSYGPGRYDEVYELDGVDYPAGYVRWTERRNLECFVDLLAGGKLAVEALVSEDFPVADAPDVYGRLHSGDLEGIGFLFRYPDPDVSPGAMSWRTVARDPDHRPQKATAGGGVKVGFIGAGNYASSMLLPHLAGRTDVELSLVATATSLSAANAQRRFGFRHASTDVESVLGDDSIDAVFIVTRHHTHAALTCRALESGKAVFVEKPLAIDDEELSVIAATVTATGNDRLMVGFNRRFSPSLGEFRSRIGSGPAGSVVRYTVNAGALDAGSWYRNVELEGSRFVGEGGHFIDTLSWLVGATPTVVHATGTPDRSDLHVVLSHEDGSMSSIDYLTHGNPRTPKEVVEVAAGTLSARFENFRRTSVWSGRRPSTHRVRGAVDKGQRAQLDHFLGSVRSGSPMPIPLGSLMHTTAATLAVERSLAAGRPVEL
jgi:predicted dehydrogenase/threonine dehydrogenase-like Zn-dependent dehydrogenase